MRANNETLIREAIRHYYRSIRNDAIAQPSTEESKVIRVMDITYIVLISASCILRVYRLRHDGTLKGYKHFPRELLEERVGVLL